MNTLKRETIARRRLLVTGLLIGLGLGGTILATSMVYQRQHERSVARFERQADDVLDLLSHSMANELSGIYALRGLFQASNEVRPQEFAVFSQSVSVGARQARALEWLPVVRGAERQAFEARARETWPGFQIRAYQADGPPVPAPDAAAYVPVYLLEPLATNSPALGLDLLSESVRRQMLEEALMTNALTVSARLRLVQNAGENGGYGVLVTLPVYASGDEPRGDEPLEERLMRCRGFVLGVYEIEKLAEHALDLGANDADELLLTIYDNTDDPTFLYSSHQQGAGAGLATLQRGLHQSSGLQIGGRNWMLVATPRMMDDQPLLPPGVIQTAVIGVLITLVAASLTSQQLTLALEIESEVDRRTLALNEANSQLGEEARIRRAAEIQLQSAEARLRAVLDATLSGIVVVNAEMSLEDCNLAFAQMRGSTRKSLRGQDPFLFFAEPHAERLRAIVADYMKTGDESLLPESDEAVGLRPAGGEMPLLLSLSGINLPDGRRVVGVVTDLTLQRQVESERDLFFRMTHDLFCVCDLEGRFQRVSQSFQSVLGWAPAKLAGESYRVLVHPDDYAVVERTLAQISAGADFGTLESRIKTVDGDYRGFIWSVLVVRERGLLYASGLDITERMNRELAINELNDNLAEANGRLESMNTELQDFAHIISHDLKAPMRGITTLVGWLETDHAENLDEEARHLLDLLRGRTDRLTDLLDGVLRYSRATRPSGAPDLVDVNKMLQEVLAMLQPPPGYRIEVQPDLPPAHIDSARLFQVFLNLIDNAVKHHDRDEGRVSISGELHDQEVWYRVSDDGPGIAASQHERIFQIFQVGHQPEDRAVSGIGLAIVKRVVDSSNGRIWVESEPGQGTTMVLALPQSPASGGVVQAGDEADPSV